MIDWCATSYDTHRIIGVADQEVVDHAGALFPDIVERDRETYGNQFPAFAEDPVAVLRDEAAQLRTGETRDRYDAFVRSTVYGEEPGFEAVANTFTRLCNRWISDLDTGPSPHG